MQPTYYITERFKLAKLPQKKFIFYKYNFCGTILFQQYNNDKTMRKLFIGASLYVVTAMASCGYGHKDATSTGDTTSLNDNVNRSNGAEGLKDSAGRKVAGDTTASGTLTKRDTAALMKH